MFFLDFLDFFPWLSSQTFKYLPLSSADFQEHVVSCFQLCLHSHSWNSNASATTCIPSSPPSLSDSCSPDCIPFASNS